MVDLIYYYSHKLGAPSTVTKKVLEHLLKRKNELPFENLKLFVSTKIVDTVKKQFSDLDVITYKDLKHLPKESIIHIPMSPLVYPNSKFLLHLYAMLKGNKLILQMHGDTRTEMRLLLKYDHQLDFTRIPTYIAEPYLLKKADKIITHSFIMSDILESYGIKNIVVIPNGIDHFWLETEIKHIEVDGEPSLFYHGRHTHRKGVHILLKGFAKAIGNSKAKLYITGKEKQTEHLKKLSNKLGIEKNVVFMGSIDKREIRSYLNNVDASIYPSLWDNFPLAFIEAFGSAKGPVYFSKKAGLYDFVIRDGFDLHAFEPTIENITEIVENVIKDNYNKKLIKQQKNFAKKYTWSNIIDYYIELYWSISNEL